MPKSIILFADGTGNSAGTVFKTNVWRLYQALDLGEQKQIATFSDGVGTSSFKPFEVIGLALGFGVKRRVLNLYEFLCLNYQPGDRIYVFGFSRGAFTVRLLVGMVAREGLVDFQSHEELSRNALAAYRSFRSKAFPAKWPWTKWGRKLRNATVSGWNWLTGSRSYKQCQPGKNDDRHASKIRINFLGVWDTVAAYGLPIDELTRAVNQWVWPLTFERSHLLPTVEKARQALSIDDERRTFFPIPWNAQDDNNNIIPQDRLLQVWFAGVHANVGGGYPDDRLAHVPLCWMIDEAAKAGLKFKEDIVQQYRDIASENGRIYDSRANLGVFYRYHPRSVSSLMGDTKPIVDWSVVARMANGPDGYAPISLPQTFSVRMPDDCIVDFPVIESQAVSAEPPDDQNHTATRFAQSFAALSGRMVSKENPAERVNLVQDTVWWRRAIYYASLFLVVLAVAFPFFSEYVSAGALSQLDGGAGPLVGWLVGILKLFLPGFAEPWLKAIARHPTLAALLISAIMVSIWSSMFLRTRIADRARIAWSSGEWHKDQKHLETEMRTSQTRLAWTVTAIGTLAALVATSSQNWRAAGVFIAIAIGSLFANPSIGRRGRASSRFSLLGFARSIRTNPSLIFLYNLLRTHILPASALVATGLFILVMLNKTSVEVASAAGAFCAKDDPPNEKAENLNSGMLTGFDPRSMCWDTGMVLQKGERYRITIEMQPGHPWKDLETPSGVAGFPAESFVHVVAVPLRRWWGYPYFQPIARIGSHGAYERPLEPMRLKGDKALDIKSAKFLFEPQETGRLYLYLNDAVLGMPGFYDVFSSNNKGGANIRVENLADVKPGS